MSKISASYHATDTLPDGRIVHLRAQTRGAPSRCHRARAEHPYYETIAKYRSADSFKSRGGYQGPVACPLISLARAC